MRDGEGKVLSIVEEKDANGEQRKIKEINSGIYCFFAPALLEGLDHLTNQNSQGEYYLTDVISYFQKKGLPVGCVAVADPQEIMGINDKEQLYFAQRRRRKKSPWSI